MYLCLQIPRKNNLIRKNNLVFSISKSSRCHKEGGTYLYTDIREGRDDFWTGHQGALQGGPVSWARPWGMGQIPTHRWGEYHRQRTTRSRNGLASKCSMCFKTTNLSQQVLHDRLGCDSMADDEAGKGESLESHRLAKTDDVSWKLRRRRL